MNTVSGYAMSSWERGYGDFRRQLARLSERGWQANAATELEFIIFRDSYDHAWHKRYAELEPANLYNVDYSMLGTTRVEPLIRRIRIGMAGARTQDPTCGRATRGSEDKAQCRQEALE
jgi:glutamine synthetase